MATQVSPGVVINEVDRSDSVTQIALTEGGIAGPFTWGPVEKVITVSSEADMVAKFGKPTNDTATTFFTAANFLSYSQTLRVVRTVNTTAYNATEGGSSDVLIKNDDHYRNVIAGSVTGEGTWAAKYAGELGNALRVEMCDSAASYRLAPARASINVGFDEARSTVTFSANVPSISVGDTLTVYVSPTVSQKRRVVTKTSNTVVTVNAAFSSAVSNGAAFMREWKYASYFSAAPGTSTYVGNKSGQYDEMHVVVVDDSGEISGRAGTILERYEGLSKASDAKTDVGAQNYYAEVLNTKSPWVWFLEHPADGTNWGDAAATTVFSSLPASYSERLSGGQGGESAVSDDIRRSGYDLFADEQVEVSFLLAGEASPSLASYIITNVAEPRKYTMAFVSPELSDVVGEGSGVDSVIAFREAMSVSSSYGVMDSGWKYQYDKYNQVYRYIPLNGDVAGLAARTEQTSDAWFSPAGFSRGQLRVGNTVKLALNPNQSDRDALYLKGINPVVAFPGEGTVLYGDKTLQTKTSAFDRINVRRLFIVLEKTVDRSAKYQLFEQNDEFTRNQFVNTIEPFLRSIKGRRGISDFYIVCDETNNPQDAIDRNEFRADIYVKPVRSVNFIQLNFVAVRSDVAFNEIISNLG